ncbi:MAG TPA: M64 family metallopeptidase, partial [Phnomibacter sp.]|nr:M64 family metallopeptidase [Phnomibacter sp.]
QTPFKEYKPFFNALAIKVPSGQSGAKHPGTAADEATAGVGHPVSNPTTAFNSTFDFANIHRLLAAGSTAPIFNALASNVPDYDQAFVISNSPFYGGSGGTIAFSSVHQSASEIAIHEIGHSFAQLADEYWAGIQYAAERANMTQNNDPNTIKWKNWLNIGNVGIFPYGTSAPQNTWYRPHQQCKMQFLGFPFCNVCRERFVDRFHQLANLVDDHLPANSSFALTNTDPIDFSVTPLLNDPSTITVNWYLNGSQTPFATNTTQVSIPFGQWIVGNNTVRAELVDNTPLSKSYLPGVGYVHSMTWTVQHSGTLPVNLLNFSGRLNANRTATLDWQVADISQVSHFEIERSSDGARFTRVARMNVSENVLRYAHQDNDPPASWVFYRINVVGKSGAQRYSQVIRLNNPVDKFVYKVYQDPQAKKYHLTVKLTQPEQIEAGIFTMDGKEIWKRNFGRVEGSLDHDIRPGIVQAGIYLMNLRIGDSRYTVRIVAE